MKLMKEEKNKKIFEDDNKVYSMINMESYVGHKHRQWYASAPEIWTLMFFDEKRADGKDIHMEALIDDSGNYTRFLVEIDNQIRVIQMHNGKVFSDTITDYRTNSNGEVGRVFTALDGDIYSPNSIPLNDYLFANPNFYLGDQLYEGVLSTNDLIVNFVNKDNELRESIANNKKSKL